MNTYNIDMENLYIFIIWNKALFARNRIIKDLKKSFTIINNFKIKWDEDKFHDNLEALYGHKLGQANDKIEPCGNGVFELIIVQDDHPEFKEEYVFDQTIKVNINIFEKKKIYRKWTAGKHRIHCSDNDEETRHDLCVLFGPDYPDIIQKKIDIYQRNTIGVEGLKNLKELMNTLYLFGNEYHYPHYKEMLIVDKSRYDICGLLNLKYETEQNIYELKVGEDIYRLIILGILDGDIPEDYPKSQDIRNMISSFVHLKTQSEIDELLNISPSSKHNPNRLPAKKGNLMKDIKDFLKYIYCSIIYR